MRNHIAPEVQQGFPDSRFDTLAASLYLTHQQGGFASSWDVFDWGRKRKKVDEARLSEEQASLQLKDTEAAVVIEVTHRYRQLAETKKEVEVAERLQTAAQEFVRVTRNQYMQKAALTSDLLKAESSLADADHRITRALLDLATAQADLEKAIGEEP